MKSGSRIAVLITLGVLLFCAGFYCRDAMTRDVIVVEQTGDAAEPADDTTPEPSKIQETPADAVRAMDLAEFTTAEEPVEESAIAEEGPIDLNTATQAELEQLPGIGPVLAQRIIEYREESGGFLAVEEVLNINGIGEKRFDAIKDLVKVEE